MKMSNLNIPPLLEQYRENMLNTKNNISIRYNYRMTLENIRDFCDKAMYEYDRKNKNFR